MSKEKVRDMKSVNSVASDVDMPEAPQPADMSDHTPPQEKMADMDVMQLELAKSKRQTAVAQAEKALAQNETAELNYKYIVLQLYMKYGLTADDAVSETGEIIRGGAVAAQKPQGK